MRNTEVNDALNNLVKVLEKHNTPGFVVIPTPLNPYFSAVKNKTNQFHKKMATEFKRMMLEEQCDLLARCKDEQTINAVLPQFLNSFPEMEEIFRDTFSKYGYKSEAIDCHISLGKGETDNVDRSLEQRRKAKHNEN